MDFYLLFAEKSRKLYTYKQRYLDTYYDHDEVK